MAIQQRFRVVLVGCGGISSIWMDAVKNMPDIDMVGFVDIAEEAARNKAAQYGAANAVVATDLLPVLQTTTPDIVFNCTIPEAHKEISVAALEYGCHVLSEKPLASTMEQAQAIITVAQQVGKTFAVMQNRRYDAQIRRLQSFLASGVIGPVTTINSDFYIGAHFSGFRNHMRHVLLLDMAIHTFDAARLLARADPVSVYCKEWNPRGSWYDHDASAVAIFEMSNGINTIVYTYRGSWCAEGLSTSWEADWRIVGEHGSATWNGADALQAQVVAQSGQFISTFQDVPIPQFHDAHKIGGHAGAIRDFINCIRNGDIPETNGQDNIKSLAMALKAVESGVQGVPISIEE